MGKRSLNRADLADEWHRKQPKGEPDPVFRGPDGIEHRARHVNPEEVLRLVAKIGALRRRSTASGEDQRSATTEHGTA